MKRRCGWHAGSRAALAKLLGRKREPCCNPKGDGGKEKRTLQPMNPVVERDQDRDWRQYRCRRPNERDHPHPTLPRLRGRVGWGTALGEISGHREQSGKERPEPEMQRDVGLRGLRRQAAAETRRNKVSNFRLHRPRNT